MNILIAGYAYIKENYFNTFLSYPESGAVNFLFPTVWTAKGGKIVFRPPAGGNVFVSPTYFHHSQYPIIGGLLKGWMPTFPLVLWRLRKRKISLVFSSSEPTLLTTLYQAFWTKLFGLKHIVFTWENVPYESKFKGPNLLFKKMIIGFTLLLSDGIVCGNQKAHDIHKRLTKKPVTVIPLSGVNTEFFHSVDTHAFLEAHGLRDKLIFSFAGAIGYRKGIHTLIQALPDVLVRIQNAHVVIAGTGEYEKEISELINKHGFEKHITLIPWLDPAGLRELLSASHIFVYPSIAHGGWEEQFGYSMAEASLMELPVISTKTGSIEDVVLDYRTGLLVKPDDHVSLAEAMVMLGLDTELRKRLGRDGRKYISENFSYSIVAKKFYGFFTKINLSR